MLIGSSTITSSRAPVIGDALRSVVDHVDICLIVDLGIEDDTLEVARQIAGDKLRYTRYEGPDECGTMRNWGLDSLTRLGVDWALSLDTDERMDFHGVDIRGALARIGDGIVLCPMDGGAYAKECFVRLPAMDRWTDEPVHECIIPRRSKQTHLLSVGCNEIPKTPEQIRAKCEVIVASLTKKTAEEPKNPRWWYYLGDAYEGLGKIEEAIHAFHSCAALRGWDEESAWSCFHEALLLDKLGKTWEALEVTSMGLIRHPGIAELAWLAGELSMRMGWPDKAIYWARMAIANGTMKGDSVYVKPRIGFRYPAGSKERPFELMARAYTALGKTEEAAKAMALLNEVAHA